MKNRIIIFVFSIATSACTTKSGVIEKLIPSDTVLVSTERDLFPEGTAYDPKSDRIFISSLYKRKVIAIEEDGSSYNFIGPASDSLWSTVGMEVDGATNTLWVISAKGAGMIVKQPIADKAWHAKLYAYDMTTARLKNIYEVDKTITRDFAFNDLTVSKSGDVYLTESLAPAIFVLRKGSTVIEELWATKDYSFFNGLALTPGQQHLFIGSANGLLKLNLVTKEHRVLSPELTTHPAPIDGLSFFRNSLIAHQSSQLTRFYLNTSLDSITTHTILDSALNSSTTGELGKNGWYYYIANAQLRTGINYKTGKIRAFDSLQNVVIKRKQIIN